MRLMVWRLQGFSVFLVLKSRGVGSRVWGLGLRDSRNDMNVFCRGKKLANCSY